MDFYELITARKSTRTYSGEPLSAQQIDRLLSAAYHAPSSRNLHPVEFIVVRDPAQLVRLSQVKTAGSDMLKHAAAAIVVLGDREKSDAWIEDCAIAMIYLQLMATELGIANCWVQCRGRKSRQTRDGALAGAPDGSPAESEAQVAAQIAAVRDSDAYLSSEEYARALLHFPEHMALEAILSLGMPAPGDHPRERARWLGRAHDEQYRDEA